MHSVNRHRIVPVKAGCAVAEVGERVIHKSGAVDALCADVFLGQRLIAGTEPVLAICLPIRLTAKRSARSPQIQHKTDLQNVGCRLHEVHKATNTSGGSPPGEEAGAESFQNAVFLHNFSPLQSKPPVERVV